MIDLTGTTDSPHAPTSADVLRECSDSHLVQFYEKDASLCETVTQFLADSCGSGGSGVIVATEVHRHGIAALLRARGVDVTALAAKGRYVSLDVGPALEHFMDGDVPDAARFHAFFQPLLAHTASRGPRGRVRAFVEIASVLWHDGRPQAAIAVEGFWNDLRKRCPLSLLCAYPLHAFDRDDDPTLFRRACAEHGHVLPTETYSHLTTLERLRYVAEIQQKAAALDEEVLRRREAEDLLRRRESELAELLERTQEGIVEIDAEGKLRWANDTQRKMLGYADGTYVGRPVSEILVHPEVFSETWRRLLQGTGVEDTTVEIRTRGGTSAPLRIDRASLRLVDKSLRMRWFLRH